MDTMASAPKRKQTKDRAGATPLRKPARGRAGKTVVPDAGGPGAGVPAILAQLERMGSPRVRAGLVRYGIVAPKAHGIPMGAIQRYAKELGRDHERARRLWKSGWYEARMLAICTADPAQLDAAQMDAWCEDFDNWAVCDTACWVLFDKTPLAWGRVAAWSKRKDEQQKRAAFALLAGLALHDKQTDDERFAACLRLVEAAAGDERNFVKKGVNWALRSIGVRSLPLHELCAALATRLAASPTASARWIGRDALRYFASPAARRRVAARSTAVQERKPAPKRVRSS